METAIYFESPCKNVFTTEVCNAVYILQRYHATKRQKKIKKKNFLYHIKSRIKDNPSRTTMKLLFLYYILFAYLSLKKRIHPLFFP